MDANEHLVQARNTFEKDIFATKTTGIKIIAAEPDYAKCELSIENKHMNAANSVMGGAIFTLADFAFAVAANTGNNLTVSLSSQINFLRAAKGKVLTAEAKCTKSGKTACFYSIEITDDTGCHVASVSTTGFRKQ